jgi:uncharacterized membrane protein YhhN
VTLFWVLIAATLAVAVVDWWAVARRNKPLEYVFKPLTMVVLAAAAVAAPDLTGGAAAARWWLVAGLACSLAGDVFLMLEDLFVPGLASFLVGHVAYVVGLSRLGVEWWAVGIGVVVVAVAMAVVGRRVVAGAGRTDRRLTGPVTAYMAVIGVMVVTAVGTRNPAAIVGALLFWFSDACIGWSRFVDDFHGAKLWIITTYHLGQIGLVLSLVAA